MVLLARSKKWKLNLGVLCGQQSHRTSYVSLQPKLVLHHPVKRLIQDFATRAVPCVLHGDGAAVTQNIGSSSKSCLFISYKMLCADQADHMLICSLWNQLQSDSKNFRTISTIWTLVAKSFEKLLNGAIHHSEKFPLLVFTSGDLEYFNVYHNLPRWNSLKPCHYCEITSKDWKRCRVVAPLPPDGWSTGGKGATARKFCPLWKTLSPYSVAVDWMHSKHLGLDQRMLGSVLWLITFHIFKDRGAIEERLALLLFKFKEYWRQNAVHGGLNSLTLGVLALVWFAFLFSCLSKVFLKRFIHFSWFPMANSCRYDCESSKIFLQAAVSSIESKGLRNQSDIGSGEICVAMWIFPPWWSKASLDPALFGRLL